nr:hypothetical protein [Kibdelosporangium sp. MJ126-NF4]CTQ88896.1 hypothetical protein [Kibdelosporangium sp. MJ126-NF4]
MADLGRLPADADANIRTSPDRTKVGLIGLGRVHHSSTACPPLRHSEMHFPAP